MASNDRWRGVLALVVLGTLIGFGAKWAADIDPLSRGVGKPCPTHSEYHRHISSPRSVAELEPEGTAGIVLPFGRTRDAKTRKFFFGVTASSKTKLPPLNKSLNVRERPLVREETDGVIDTDQYVANLRVTGTHQVTLEICIDPADQKLDPGTYNGSVVSDDPRISDVTVPLTVTIQYPRWRWVAYWLGLLVVAAGSFFVWASSRGGDSGDDANKRPQLEGLGASIAEWLRWSASNTVGIAIGVVAAASAFLAVYINDPGWGASAPADWFALLASMFTAFTAGLTGIRASVELPRRRRERKQHVPHPNDENLEAR